MRLFLAINPAAALRHRVYEATTPLREAVPSLRWVQEAKLHFTLKFFGEQAEEKLQPLHEALTGVAARHRVISVRLGGIGAFPNLKRARVVWMGVEREPRLELLHHDVEIACEALGYEVEGRPFRPHLTLARVGERMSIDDARAIAQAAKLVRFREELVVESVDLMASTLSSAGSRYDLLAAAPLRST